MYQYVRQRYERYVATAKVLQEDAMEFGSPLTEEGTNLLTRYIELQAFPAEYLQRFFERLANLLPSGIYDEPVRETVPDGDDKCLSFEILADAIVDVADQILVEHENYESPPY